MRSILAAITMVSATTAFADNLEDLKAASVRYVAAIKVALTISDDSDSPELVVKANDYAAVKIAYYTAARKAMPALLQMAKGQKSDTSYANEITEIFRGFGEDRDEEAMGALEAKLNRCPTSDQRNQARLAGERAKQTAEQFVEDF